MRKIILLSLAIIAMINFTWAQSEENVQNEVLKTKRGVPILPTKGNYAIGIDATPMFYYLGNMVNMYGNNSAPSFSFTAQNPGSIYGKYKKSDRTAYRGALLIGYTTDITKTANATDQDLIDKRTQSALNIGIILGLEKNRRMFGRLVGNYGVQVGMSKSPYVDPATGVLGKSKFVDAENSDNSYKNVGGNEISFLAGAFVGVEYFFAPRISIGGEFAYNLSLYTQTKRVFKPNVGTETTTDFGGSGISLSPAASGHLQLLFYF